MPKARLAFERNLLLDKFKAVQSASNSNAGRHALVGDFTAAVIESAALMIFSSHRSRRLAKPHPLRACAGMTDPLTRREWDVLRGVAAGETNAQIAVNLFVAEGTVKTHVKHVLGSSARKPHGGSWQVSSHDQLGTSSSFPLSRSNLIKPRIFFPGQHVLIARIDVFQ